MKEIVEYRTIERINRYGDIVIRHIPIYRRLKPRELNTFDALTAEKPSNRGEIFTGGEIWAKKDKTP